MVFNNQLSLGFKRELIMVLINNNKISCGDTVQVKLSGDGTKVCRKLNLINVTFTLLNEGDVAKSPRGNHTIAIINGTETYDSLINPDSLFV